MTTVDRGSDAGPRAEIPVRDANSGDGATTWGLPIWVDDSLAVEARKSGGGGTAAAFGASIDRRVETAPTFAAGATATSRGKLSRRFVA